MILYDEAEVFTLPIADPNRRLVLPFDWLIHSGLILAHPSNPKSQQTTSAPICLAYSLGSNLSTLPKKLWRATGVLFCFTLWVRVWARRVDVPKFVQPADPNGFVFFDLQQNWQSIAPFSKCNQVWSSNQHVWNDRAFVVFLSHPHLPLPFLIWFVLHRLNYLQYHVVKGLLERSFVWKRKTL